MFPRAGKAARIVYRAGSDGQHTIDCIELIFNGLHILHGGHADRRPDVPHQRKLPQ